MYPPFDYEDVRIDAMGYRKKRVNASKNRTLISKQRKPRSTGHARKATIAPCDQTGPTSRGAAQPVSAENAPSRSMSLLICRSSAFRRAGFPSRADAARAPFKSRTMEKRFTATRREGVETPMYAASGQQRYRAAQNNCIHGLASRTKVRASQAVPQTTPQTGRCRRHPIQRSFLLTGPRRPAM